MEFSELNVTDNLIGGYKNFDLNNFIDNVEY